MRLKIIPQSAWSTEPKSPNLEASTLFWIPPVASRIFVSEETIWEGIAIVAFDIPFSEFLQMLFENEKLMCSAAGPNKENILPSRDKVSQCWYTTQHCFLKQCQISTLAILKACSNQQHQISGDIVRKTHSLPDLPNHKLRGGPSSLFLPVFQMTVMHVQVYNFRFSLCNVI